MEGLMKRQLVTVTHVACSIVEGKGQRAKDKEIPANLNEEDDDGSAALEIL